MSEVSQINEILRGKAPLNDAEKSTKEFQDSRRIAPAWKRFFGSSTLRMTLKY